MINTQRGPSSRSLSHSEAEVHSPGMRKKTASASTALHLVPDEERRPRARRRPTKQDLQEELDVLREGAARRSDRGRRIRRAVTLTTAALIPGFGLLMTLQAGGLYRAGSSAYGVLALLAACVYSVSLPHVKDGLARVTGCSGAQAWALACAMDFAVVGGEVTRLASQDPTLAVLAWVMMALGAVFASVYNAVGFLEHAE